ncbi:putative G-protein coupled receptor 133 [Stylophora pistillata]|uniref:Putative G-protein coupled receptor 133 n=1 Tax=Stylophora pistillata TaxID=50429 RepID=A0A2B4R9K9_STYPI|nr:putative G-protein coupled receptor 133 [Stylophora pistillata]
MSTICIRTVLSDAVLYVLIETSSSTSPPPSLPPPSPSRKFQKLEARRAFELFVTGIENITKSVESLSGTETKTLRRSTFGVAVAFEEFALNYSKLHTIGRKSAVVIDSHRMGLRSQNLYRQNASDFYFREQEWKASIKVPSANFANNVSMFVGIVYKDLHDLLIVDQPIGMKTSNKRYLGSRIMAVTMDPKPNKLKENVILKFSNLRVDGEKKCMFWSGFSEGSDGFSDSGCQVVTSKSNSEETVCSCNHLTHFAVLVDYNGIPGLTKGDETNLEFITYVGLSLSIIGILLTIMLYSFLTDIRQPLSQIRLSLSVSLGAGQGIFLAGVNATENTASCVTAAALMQYFLMAAFCWMLVEGIYLYLFVVKVYNISEKMLMYHIMSWGLPIIMVGISLCISAGKDGIGSYISDKYCWLSSTNNLIWIFVAFVAFMEALNIFILVRVIKEVSKLTQPTGEDNHTQQIQLCIKTCVVMIPLLGITWVFGLLLPLHKAFSYIFTIFNSTQGFLIFVFHCVRDSQIRERLKRKMNTIFPFTDNGRSAKKNSQVNPSDVGNAWAVELQSFHDKPEH